MDQKLTVNRSRLLDMAWDIQRKKRFISHDDISKIAQELNMSRMQVEGVLTFYHFFHRKPAGKYTIYINDSIIAKYSGHDSILKAFEDAVGVHVGHVTPDETFGLFRTPCIGLSDQEPSCLINFYPFVNLHPERVHQIIGALRSGKKPREICDTPESKIQYTPEEDRTVFLKPYDQFSSLRHLKDYNPEELIELIKTSKLGGCGGAFFPTGLKWQFCRQNVSDERFIICNADEGEPGTFKDRVLLESYPELVIEGMIHAGYAIGAKKGYIYLRAEYRYLMKKIEKVLKSYRNNGWLGKNINAKESFDFDIRIQLGAGAYVCGEETALIHSMEGKRGEPGTKEYFPVERGFKGKPTVVNNVETLAAVPRILNMGIDHWLDLGTEKSPGTKLLSVSGDCANEGIFEIEWGMNVWKLIDLMGAEDPKMIQFSGPSGTCLSQVDFDRDICREDLICGGSVMVFNQSRNLLEILKNYSNFFVEESCGICVPCRTGNFLLNKKINKLILGHGEKKDLDDIKEWSEIITTTSRCGLGQMSSNSLEDMIEKFPDVFDKSLSVNTNFNKAFNLKEATADYDDIIKEMTTDYE
ncbi:MAG: NADP oxidoreductase [Flavobacteriaceae bacterium]|nr:NAD(P)H-dependent oxidoreductase subunit E [Bacteroidia bacterium]NNK87034.1 NADP oxidoreductase [Flavobacteriaceae bacterium]